MTSIDPRRSLPFVLLAAGVIAAVLVFGRGGGDSEQVVAADTTSAIESIDASSRESTTTNDTPDTSGDPGAVTTDSDAPIVEPEADFVIPTTPSTTIDMEAVARYVLAVEALKAQEDEVVPLDENYTELTLTSPVAPAAAPAPGTQNPPAWGGQAVTPSPGGAAPPWTGELDEAGRPLAVYRGLVGNFGFDQQVVAPLIGAPGSPGAGRSPLTGLTSANAGRAALIVKVDNSSAARPQAGLTSADIVFEERVEGGITRLALVFQANNAVVGPVRSVRSTDIGIIGSFNRPLFGWSGGNLVFRRLLAEQPIVDAGSGAAGGYWRQSGYSAPHNLFADSGRLAAIPGGGVPPAQFVFRASGGSLPAGANPVTRALINNGASPSAFTWDGTGWLRDMRGTPQVDATNSAQARPANVIIQETQLIETGLTDPALNPVFEDLNVGQGPAVVLTAGHAINAIWTKPSVSSVTTYTDGTGAHIEMTPGQTWIMYVAPGTYSFA